MADIKSFDELNVIVGYERSEPYEDYFDLDWLSEDEKERRVETAEKLEDHFRPLFLYLFYAALASAEIDWEYFESGLRVEYASALEEMGYTINDRVNDRIDTFAREVRDSSGKRITILPYMDDGELWYLSDDRLRYISENESQNTNECEEFIQAVLSGMSGKEWVNMGDKRVRKTHVIAGGQIKPIMEPFEVGNSLLLYPGDYESHGASAEEIVGCRCHARYF